MIVSNKIIIKKILTNLGCYPLSLEHSISNDIHFTFLEYSAVNHIDSIVNYALVSKEWFTLISKLLCCSYYIDFDSLSNIDRSMIAKKEVSQYSLYNVNNITHLYCVNPSIKYLALLLDNFKSLHTVTLSMTETDVGLKEKIDLVIKENQSHHVKFNLSLNVNLDTAHEQGSAFVEQIGSRIVENCTYYIQQIQQQLQDGSYLQELQGDIKQLDKEILYLHHIIKRNHQSFNQVNKKVQIQNDIQTVNGFIQRLQGLEGQIKQLGSNIQPQVQEPQPQYEFVHAAVMVSSEELWPFYLVQYFKDWKVNSIKFYNGDDSISREIIHASGYKPYQKVISQLPLVRHLRVVDPFFSIADLNPIVNGSGGIIKSKSTIQSFSVHFQLSGFGCFTGLVNGLNEEEVTEFGNVDEEKVLCICMFPEEDRSVHELQQFRNIESQNLELWKEFCDSLAKNSTLKTLFISNDCVEDHHVKQSVLEQVSRYLGLAISNNSSIQHLSLSCDLISESFFKVLSARQQQPQHTATSSIRHLGLYSALPHHLEYASDLMKYNKSITTFKIFLNNQNELQARYRRLTEDEINQKMKSTSEMFASALQSSSGNPLHTIILLPQSGYSSVLVEALKNFGCYRGQDTVQSLDVIYVISNKI